MKLLLFIFISSPLFLLAQPSVSLGFSTSNSPFKPYGYAINADYTIPIGNGRFTFKPNIGFKNMKSHSDWAWLTSQNATAAINAVVGYELVNNDSGYKLITYGGPTMRYTKFWIQQDRPEITEFVFVKGPHYNFVVAGELGGGDGEGSMEFFRPGFAVQVENQFQLANHTVSVVPFLECDISYDPNSGGLYLTYYF